MVDPPIEVKQSNSPKFEKLCPYLLKHVMDL